VNAGLAAAVAILAVAALVLAFSIGQYYALPRRYRRDD